MSELSEAEFEQAEALIGGGVRYVLGTVIVVLLGAILASGWSLWLQSFAAIALAAIVVVASVDTSNPATDRHFKTGHHDDRLRLVIGSA
ncbi:hypothetical membrane protein [Gemmatimonas aurantiaca T-27]|nr:hypothetical membrane protein [Gemmatimonas aurantiaca T-27]